MKAKAMLLAAMVLVGATACSGSSDGGAKPATSGGGAPTTRSANPPAPPRVPTDFQWKGRYVVPELGVEVPFTWDGRGGNFQMTAGREGDPIHFTNVVYDGTLYTLTYAWPNIPRMPCSNVGPFTLDDLNQALAKARFVGPETLDDGVPLPVNHFRASVAVDLPPGVIPAPAGVPLRIPILSGDFYVDRDDPTRLQKLLHFGLQNLYAADLDEWMIIDSVSTDPGTVTLPEECATAPAPSTTATTKAP